MAEVRLAHISKRYDKTPVIHEMDLTVADREFLVLVGPSGCGKSTVLRMIAGLETLTTGDISIAGRVVNDIPPKDRDIAMVFQSYALYPHMSVFDNMAFGLKMRKTPKADIQSRVASAAQILDLTHLLDRKPRQLSGGQRQRVALGRAIVRNPQVFLMDEPLSNLDAKLRVQMRSEILKLHRQLGATTIYVTHDQVEAMTMGDRIVVLNDGVVQQVGPPEQLYRQPANQFVGGFIGSMAFIPAVLTEQGVISGETLLLPSGTTCFERLRVAVETGASLTIGVRPEHMVPEEANPVARVTPELVETLGNEIRVHFSLAGVDLVAAFAPDAEVKEGQPLGIAFKSDHLNWFDAEGRNIFTPSLIEATASPAS